MKLFVNVTLVFLLLAAPFLLFLPLGVFPSFYDARYMGLVAVVEVAILLLAPRFLYPRNGEAQYAKKKRAANQGQFLLGFMFFGNGLGDAGLYQLYQIGFEYDKLLHMIIPFVSIMVVTRVLHDRFEFPQRTALLSAFVGMIIVSLIWEVSEFTFDRLFKTHLYGVNGVNISCDTQIDLVCDVLGASAALLLLWLKDRPPFYRLDRTLLIKK